MTIDRPRILLVEDDPDVARALALRLRDDFEVLVAHDGHSAMRIIRHDGPRAIVLDLGIPAGSGANVISWLGEDPDRAGTPVIVVTGQDARSPAVREVAARVAAVLEKPIDAQHLSRLLRDVIPSVATSRRKILIVEDDPDVRRGFSTQLREGYSVVTAEDGATGLMAATKHAPDAVLLDIGLPAGDGLQLLRRMRAIEALATTPVVVVTARSDSASYAKAMEYGADAFLAKPVSRTELLDAIDDVVSR